MGFELVKLIDAPIIISGGTLVGPAIAISNATYTSGTVVFEAGNNISLSTSGQTISIHGQAGGGDVAGPASATSDHIAVFDGTTGKIIKDGGYVIPLITGGYSGLISPPNITDNGNGTITVASTTCHLYATTDFTGALTAYTIPEATLTPTNNVSSTLSVNYNSGSPIYTIEVQGTVNWSNTSAIQTCYREGNSIYFVDWDSIANGLAEKLFIRFLKVQRFAWESGLSLGETTGRVITVSAGKAWNGATRNQSIDAFSSATGTCRLWYHASSTYTKTAITQYDNTQYDNGVDLQTAPDDSYVVNWVYRHLSDTSVLADVLLGNSVYTSLADAEAAQPPASLPTFISTHCFLVGKIIVLKNDSTASAIQSAFVTSFTSSPVTDHNLLNNLQGGTTGQYYHLNSSYYGNITGDSYLYSSLSTNFAGIGTSATNASLTLNSNGLAISVGAGGGIAAAISGNSTSGGGGYSTLSNGTMYIAGGNNITLSQDGQSITISGPNAGGAQTGISGIAGSGASTATAGTVQFQTGNGITFGLNGNTITASHNALTTAMASNAGSNFIYASAGKNLTNISATLASNSISLSVGNYITTARASNDAIGLNTAGTNITWTANSSGLSISIPAYLTTAAQSGHSHGNPTLNLTNLSGTTASNSGGLTLSLSAGNYITTGRASNDAVGLNTAGTNITWTVNSSGISINNPAWITTAAQSGHSHGNPTLNLTNLSGTTASASNGLTISLSAVNALTTARASNDAIGLNTAGTNVTWTVNSSGLSLNAGRYAGTGTSATNASITLNTNGLAISVANPGAGGGIAGAIGGNSTSAGAGYATVTSGTWLLAGGNNITLSQNGQFVTISGANAGGAQTGISGVGVSNTTYTSGTIIFSGVNLTFNSSVNGASQYVQITAPAVSSLSAQTNITIGTTGSTIGFSVGAYLTTAANSTHSHGNPTLALTNLSGTTASASNGLTLSLSAAAPGGGAAVTGTVFENYGAVGLVAGAVAQGTVYVMPIQVPYSITATEANLIGQISNSASAAGTVTVNLALYTCTGSTANSVSSISYSTAYNSTQAASSYTHVSGTRYRSIPLNNWNITAGNYLLAFGMSVGTGLTSGTYSLYGRSALSMQAQEFAGGNVLKWGMPGVFSAATNAARASFHVSAINRTGAAANRQPYIMFMGTN